MLHNVIALYLRQSAREISRLGIGVHAARVLARLLGGPAERRQLLALETDIDTTSLSHTLRALESQKLITRARSEKDNRSVAVRLTPKGREVAAQCARIEAERERVLRNGVADEDLERFSEILARITSNLAEVPVASGAEAGKFAASGP